MNLAPIAITTLTSLLVTGIQVAAATEVKKPSEKKEAEKKGALYVSSADAKHLDVITGVSRAVISGDPAKGAYQYRPKNGNERRVSPGA